MRQDSEPRQHQDQQEKGSNGSGVIDFDPDDEHCAKIVASLEAADKSGPAPNRRKPQRHGSISTWLCLESTATIQDLTKLSAQDLQDGLAKDVEPQMLGTLGPAQPWWQLKAMLEQSAAVQLMVRVFPWNIEDENKKGIKIYVEGMKLFGEGASTLPTSCWADSRELATQNCGHYVGQQLWLLRSSADINTHGALHSHGECTMMSQFHGVDGVKCGD